MAEHPAAFLTEATHRALVMARRRRVCGKPDCGELAPPGKRLCPEHDRSSLGTDGGGAAWQRRRQEILERDHYVCHWCGAAATTVDHVWPRSAGGDDSDSNLVAACAPCNTGRR